MKHFLDTAEAAELLSLAPGTLQKWRVKGGGPEFRKLGSRVVYPVESLLAWVNARPLKKSTSDKAGR